MSAPYIAPGSMAAQLRAEQADLQAHADNAMEAWSRMKGKANRLLSDPATVVLGQDAEAESDRLLKLVKRLEAMIDAKGREAAAAEVSHLMATVSAPAIAESASFERSV